MMFGGAPYGARLFQITVGSPEKMAAMIAVLSSERWPYSPSQPATFLWFLSTAPASYLRDVNSSGGFCTPKLVGRAAFQVALHVALAAPGYGRLWLHADPKGGQPLYDWYRRDLKMQVIDPKLVPSLPGRGGNLRGRQNDGRYFGLDANDAAAVYDGYDPG